MLTMVEVRMIHDTYSTQWANSYYPLGLIVGALNRAANELEAAAENEVLGEKPYPIKMTFQQDTNGLEVKIKITQHT